MTRTNSRMSRFNWPVFGPLLGIITTLVLVGTVIGVRVWPDGSAGDASAPRVTGVNLERDAPPSSSLGTGGAGPVLQPPAAQELKLRSLPARVSGTPNVRRGPGPQYASVHALQNGEEVSVIACSPGCEWYRILSLTDAQAQHWVPAIFLTVNGRADTLPVLTP